MQKLIVANWKMNPSTLQEALALGRACDKKGVVLCPPFPFLWPVDNALEHALLGAQDCSGEEGGSWTGQVSAGQIKDCGVKYIIIGHSERRRYFQEDDAMVAQKLATCLKAGLIPVLCVGETQEEREAGLRDAVIAKQVQEGLKKLPLLIQQNDLLGRPLLVRQRRIRLGRRKERGLAELVVAYEPVWAIGTGEACSPEEAAKAQSIIRQVISRDFPQFFPALKVIYGGSIKADNAHGFLIQEGLDGLLVGGSSLKAEEFISIVSPPSIQ